MSPARKQVAVVIGATSKWQADGRNTRLAHGKAVDDSDLPVGVRWGVGAKERFLVVLTTRAAANASALEQAIKAQGGESVTVELDLVSQDSISRASAAIRDRVGDPHVVVYNAGLPRGTRSTPDGMCQASVERRKPMKMKLHHLNLTTTNVSKMNDFYRNVMGLAAEPSLSSARITNQGYAGETAFATDGHVQVHMSEKDLALGFRQKQFVNPLERGHIAFRTDDIAAFKKRLEEKGVPYSDYGTWAMNGWHQIFFHDPDGNVVEVHQANE